MLTLFGNQKVPCLLYYSRVCAPQVPPLSCPRPMSPCIVAMLGMCDDGYVLGMWKMSQAQIGTIQSGLLHWNVHTHALQQSQLCASFIIEASNMYRDSVPQVQTSGGSTHLNVSALPRLLYTSPCLCHEPSNWVASQNFDVRRSTTSKAGNSAGGQASHPL